MSPRLHAIADLFMRYGAAFRSAWQQRVQMTPETRLPHEAQFLPAALSLQDTPMSPAPRAAMWMLIGFAVLAVLWASFGQIDVVATANGKVVPNDRSKTIQPFETATVKAIHVTDGQQVQAGDLLRSDTGRLGDGQAASGKGAGHVGGFGWQAHLDVATPSRG